MPKLFVPLKGTKGSSSLAFIFREKFMDKREVLKLREYNTCFLIDLFRVFDPAIVLCVISFLFLVIQVLAAYLAITSSEMSKMVIFAAKCLCVVTTLFL